MHGHVCVVAPGVQRERGAERGRLQLVHAHRAREGMAAEPGDEVCATDDAPGLWASEELVAAERDEVGARREGAGDRGLVAGEAPFGVEQARADVVEERDLLRVGERRELGGRRLRGEADDAVVGGVDLEDRRGAIDDRPAVVGDPGAVRGTDLDQLRPGGGHDVWDPELAADLDQLAARDEDGSALGERRERQHQRRRAVVDDEGALRARDGLQERLGARAPRAARTGIAIHLEVGVVPRRARHRPDRLGSQRRATEVRVEQDPGRVDHGREPVRGLRRAPDRLREDLVAERRLRAGLGLRADLLEDLGDGALDQRPPERRDRASAGARAQQGVDARDLPSRVGGHGRSLPIRISPRRPEPGLG